MKAKHKKSNFWFNKGIFNNLKTFSEFEKRIEALDNEIDQGDVFEIFVEGFLYNDPLLQCTNHWVVGNIPIKIREKLNLPKDSKGIDGVFETKCTGYIPYQVKYRKADRLNFREISTFLGVTERSNDRIIFSNVKDVAKDVRKRDGIRLCLASQFNELKPFDFERIKLGFIK